MLIEVKNPTIEVRSHTNEKTGEIREFYGLECWAVIDPLGYPEKAKVNVDSVKSVPTGTYLIPDSSHYMGSFGKINLGTVKPRLLDETEIETYMSLQLDEEQLVAYMEQRT